MSLIRPAVVLFILLTLITGGVYPLLTTALGQWWFPQQANGSLVRIDGEVRGSSLIGQNFTAPGYFQGRPSATAEVADNPLASGGSNLAASNPALDKAISDRVQALRAANPEANPTVPVELVTASASGLDYSLTPAAALWQVARVAKARQLSVEQVRQMVNEATQKPLLSFLGQPVVNILQLNMSLDALKEK
ncbi:potassium-transporting ATPase subunit KdpC [Klebsiella oxytoca]|uniref:Potassium-transporting ATPase KdpC subunit n=1 Tax=Klebsiella oxytoca TaxID=571 RepID=A0A6B8MSD2_KLEOX|nr:potassium-transporting ATPase subunit KdpC [Klebsiella oxytoca]QGN37234.1 potassium-transporting ATPase subunit KdpC [Klebsiella oxytoca]